MTWRGPVFDVPHAEPLAGKQPKENSVPGGERVRSTVVGAGVQGRGLGRAGHLRGNDRSAWAGGAASGLRETLPVNQEHGGDLGEEAGRAGP